MVKQISVFVENRLGSLAQITEVLTKNDINIRALSIADTTDFGILRLIVNKPTLAKDVLSESGFTVATTSVIAITVKDQPGGLYHALKILAANEIPVEYMYAYIGRHEDEALVVLRVENFDKAMEILITNGVGVLEEKEIYDN